MSRSALTFALQVLAYNDESRTSNPRKKPIEWGVSMANMPFENAGTFPTFVLPPGASWTAIDGSRSLAVDNTTAFSLAASSLSPVRYRLAHTGGTAPGFRTDRALVLDTIVLTLTVNSNQTVTLAAGSGTPFTAVQVGDTVYIPGVSTGDPAGQFNPMNEGFWRVLVAAGAQLTVARTPGDVFSAVTETITVSGNTALRAYSSAGVQAGDTLYLSAGVASSAFGSYEILAATAYWLEFQSTLPLGQQTGLTPNAAGIAIYTSAKRFLMVETDQDVVVQLNGSTDMTNIVSPVLPGQPRFAGQYIKFGPAWKVVLINLSSIPANVTVAAAE
jgi:hypothetical protein